MSNPHTAALSAAGVSIWLDDLSRPLLTSGRLKKLIDEFHVVGVTTNPTIFAQAIGAGEGYTEAIAEYAALDFTAEAVVEHLSCEDVAHACDVLAPTFAATGGENGRVSIEVSPLLAHDTAGTIAAAHRLWQRVDRPNAMIKIPATLAGLEAITDVVASGISVNVTLIFSLTRYRQVLNAYLTGLERARAAGLDLSSIRSVASIFVSRFDSYVDPQLAEYDDLEAQSLVGKTGIANARLAHEVAVQAHTSERAQMLIAAGAHPQRPLWASTGVKHPSLPDTWYVSNLVTQGVVNTMPAATLAAVADHGHIDGDTVVSEYREADQTLNLLDGFGIDYEEAVIHLESEGLQKFEKSWSDLLHSVSVALEAYR